MTTSAQIALKVQKARWKAFIDENDHLFDIFFLNNYLVKCQVLAIEKDKIIVSVPSTYTKKILMEKGIDKMFQEAPWEIQFTVIEKWATSSGGEKPKIMQKKPIFTFDNLIVGKFNASAVNIARRIVNKENVWCPFFVYSEPGLGKTHILKAIEHHAKTTGQNCHYIHANSFGSLLFEAFNKGAKETEEFINQFKNYDIIVVDDIQFLARRDKTNEVLFKIFTNAIDEQKQVVFSSDQHPAELSGFEKRLKSRFEHGITLKIDYPSVGVAAEIVKQKTETLVKNVSKVDIETIDFIAKHFKKDIRKIEGIVKKIAFYLIENPNAEININLFKSIFADQEFIFANTVSTKKIKKTVTKFYGISYNSILSKSRKSLVVKARSVAMYLIRQLTDENYSTIALQFNAKTHATAVNAIKKIKTQMIKTPELKKEVEHLKQLCQND